MLCKFSTLDPHRSYVIHFYYNRVFRYCRGWFAHYYFFRALNVFLILMNLYVPIEDPINLIIKIIKALSFLGAIVYS